MMAQDAGRRWEGLFGASWLLHLVHSPMWEHKFCVSLGFRMCSEICQATWKQQLQCWGTERLSWKLRNIPAPFSSSLMASREGLRPQNKRPRFICCGRKYGKCLRSDSHLVLVLLPTKRLQVWERKGKVRVFLFFQFFCPIIPVLSPFFWYSFYLDIFFDAKARISITFALLSLCFAMCCYGNSTHPFRDLIQMIFWNKINSFFISCLVSAPACSSLGIRIHYFLKSSVEEPVKKSFLVTQQWGFWLCGYYFWNKIFFHQEDSVEMLSAYT